MLSLNNKLVTPTMFSDNTSQVWKVDGLYLNFSSVQHRIEWTFESEGEFMQLAQLVNLLHRVCPHEKIHLHMDYLPYARQDKKVTNESTFALQTFAQLLNSLKLDYVTVLDAHSDVPEYIISNFRNSSPAFFVQETVKRYNTDIICFPDAGAKTRYHRDLMFLGKTHLFGDKTRDQSSGMITEYKVNGPVQDKNVLICDDIVDGGMTFILLAKELLSQGAKEVALYTTHGLYSKGMKPLKEAGIKRFFDKRGELDEVQGNLIIKEKF